MSEGNTMADSSYQNILLAVDGPVATVTLNVIPNRPPVADSAGRKIASFGT